MIGEFKLVCKNLNYSFTIPAHVKCSTPKFVEIYITDTYGFVAEVSKEKHSNQTDLGEVALQTCV